MPQIVDLKAVIEDVEVGWLRKAMREHCGNQTRAAQALGITRDNLRYRIKKYGENYLMQEGERGAGSGEQGTEDS